MTVTEIKGSSITAQNEEHSVFRDASQFRRLINSDSDDDEEEPAATIHPEAAQGENAEVTHSQPVLEEPTDTSNPNSPEGQPTVAERHTRRNVRPPAWCADYEM